MHKKGHEKKKEKKNVVENRNMHLVVPSASRDSLENNRMIR